MEDVPDITTILVAFDGSDQSKRALRTALVIARALDARLHSVFVIEPGKGIPRVRPLSVRFGGTDGGIQAVSRTYRDESLRMEKRIADIARDVSVPVRTSTRIGDPPGGDTGSRPDHRGGSDRDRVAGTRRDGGAPARERLLPRGEAEQHIHPGGAMTGDDRSTCAGEMRQ